MPTKYHLRDYALIIITYLGSGGVVASPGDQNSITMGRWPQGQDMKLWGGRGIPVQDAYHSDRVESTQEGTTGKARGVGPSIRWLASNPPDCGQFEQHVKLGLRV